MCSGSPLLYSCVSLVFDLGLFVMMRCKGPISAAIFSPACPSSKTGNHSVSLSFTILMKYLILSSGPESSSIPSEQCSSLFRNVVKYSCVYRLVLDFHTRITSWSV